jgi:Calx-beta domain
MDLIADHGRLGLFLVPLIISAALVGCGGGGSSSASGPSGSSTVTSATFTPVSRVALSSSQYPAAPSSNAVLTIYRSGSPQGSVTVGYTTVDVTGTAGVDYVATSGSVTWQDGEASAQTVTVPVTGLASGTSFAVALTSVEGEADFGTPAFATVEVGTTASNASSNSGISDGTSTTTSITLSWLAPSRNANGTALTNLAGYNIYYGTNAAALTQKVSVDTTGILAYVIPGLYPGTWYFAVTSINAWGLESSPSALVSATI